MISPKFVDYFLQPFPFLHFFQNKKTKMSAKKFSPRSNLLSWIEHIAKIVVQLSWWRQPERVKIPHIISSFEPRDPVRPISISVILVHNCALISIWFLWQSVSQEKDHESFSNQSFSPHLRLLRVLFGRTTLSTLMFIYSKQNFPISLATSFQFLNPLLQP